MKYIFLLLSFLLINSCIITRTPGFYNGYKDLSEEEKGKVVFLAPNSKIDTLRNNGQIVVVYGEQLREYITNSDTIIIYRWSPNCTADACISVLACQEFCTSKNYKLIVIAEYYNLEKMEVQNIGNLPIFIPNHIYYKKYYANRLNRLFMEDILKDNKLENDEQDYRFLILNKGKIVDFKNKLPL